MTLNYQYFDVANEFISTLGEGYMPGVIYDTAVVGSLSDNTGISRFPTQVKRVIDSQLPDGSWGAEFYNPYDRLLSTIATMHMITELELDNGNQIRSQLEEASSWLEDTFDSSLNYQVPMPVGFEFLFHHYAKRVMAKTTNLNINLSSLEYSKKKKLEKLGDMIFTHPTPLLFSIEGVVENEEQARQVAQFQSPNGSIGTSPAATSIILQYGISEKIPQAMRFLQESIAPNGLFQHFNDYQHMNISFALYPLIKADYQFGVQGLQLSSLLNEGWTNHGVSFGKSFLSPDADDTSMVLLDLDFLGNRDVQDKMDVLLQYEKEEYFQTYFGEVNPALMTNIHVLEAFLTIDHERGDEVINKLLKFITKNQDDLLTISKYNSSILIQQSSLVLSLLPKMDSITRPIVDRLEELAIQSLETGITIEECAHTLLALLYAKKHRQEVNSQVIDRLHTTMKSQLHSGIQFSENYTWSAKVQYSPSQISKAHVIGALMLYDNLNMS